MAEDETPTAGRDTSPVGVTDASPAAGRDASPAETGAEHDTAPTRPSSLFVWATGSFHAALLVTVLVIALHWSGAAGDLLEGVGTLPGALAYLYLWAVALATTRRAIRASGVTAAGGVPDGWNALRTALLWGGVTGVGFYAGLFVVAAVRILLFGGLDAVDVVVLFLVAGSLVSAIVGTVVGVLFALLDLAVLRAAVRVTGDLSGGGP